MDNPGLPGTEVLDDDPHPVLKDHPLPMLGEGTKCPIYTHILVGADLVSARVSENQDGVVTTGGHKILTYTVVGFPDINQALSPREGTRPSPTTIW
jgi:hypothetical protein